jgi:peptide/nickel transport system substrate-binding protein
MKKMTYLVVGIMLLASLLILACGSPATPPVPTPTVPKVSSPAAAAPTTAAPTSAAPAKPAASTPASNKYGGVLKLALSVSPSTPMGYPAEGAPDSLTVAGAAVEHLVSVKLGGIVIPVLATSWDIDPAAKTMVFHLRKGVKFHDGSDFNASVVKWNFELVMAAKKVPNFVSVDVIDDYTVKITLKNYQNTDLTALSGGTYNIVSKASFDKNGLDYTRSHPIGTGPFKFVEYIRDSKVTFTKNPDYWDTGKPYLDGIVYNVVPEETVRKLMFQRGDVQILQAAGITAQELQQSGAIMKTQAGGSFGLVPDSNNPNSPFAKLAVRQAVSYAIDRESFAAGLGFGFMKPGYQLYGGYAACTIPGLQKTPFDPNKAKQLLKDAGYPGGFKTSIHSFTRVISNDWVTALAKMLSDVGIQTEPDFPTSGKYEEYRSNGWNNSLMAHAFLNADNFNSIFNIYFPSTNVMFPSVKKPDGFTAAVTASLTSPQVDPAKLQALFKMMNDDLMVIPYGEQVQAQFYNKGVNDPGADDYAFVILAVKEAWLDASAR